MANQNAKIDDNGGKTLLGVTDDAAAEIRRLLVDPTTGRLKVSAIVSAGSGITSINTDGTAAQTLTVGTTGTDFAIVDNGTGDHKFNLPDAGAAARGVVSTGAQTFAGVKTLTSPKIVTQISDTNGNAILTFSATASAVDSIQITNGATGLGPVVAIEPVGSDSNVSFRISPKGTGTVRITDGTDLTKLVVFDASGATTGKKTTLTFANTVDRIVTFPDAAGTVTLLGNSSTGSGAIVLANTPTLITPVLGVATATSINKVAFTAPATSATLTIADGKTLTVSNTLTFTGTDSSSVAFGAGGTVLYANQSITLSGDVTGTGTTAITTTVAKVAGTTVSGTTGTVNVVFSTSPTLTTPVLGVASATTINKVTLTTPAAGSTLTILDGKTLTVNKTLVLDGTDSTTMTFPSTSATIARTDAANTFTGAQTFSNALIYTNNAIAASGNAATVPITAKLNTVTNNSAATLTITMTTTSATDGQMTIVRILDSSAAAQTITWVNTEDSTVAAPTTSNGSTTLFLTVGFIYNSGTSKWRCIAKA